MHSRYVFFADRPFSAAELSALRMDGMLFELGDGYIPADAVETAGLRAASVAVLADPRIAGVGMTAAWIHGAVDAPPRPHHAQRATVRRVGRPPGASLRYTDYPLPQEDTQRIGGVRVASPARTFVDLSRGGETERAAAARLVADPAHAAAARTWLSSRSRFPGRAAAAAFLAGLRRG